LEKAEKHLKKALEIAHRTAVGSNNETILWRLLGDVYAAQNKTKQASGAYTTCQNLLAKFSKVPQKDEEAAMYRGWGVLYSRQGQMNVARNSLKKALDIFETCNNQWEKAKTFVIAAESNIFTQAEMEPNLAWAKEVFKRLEHPSWVKRARVLLKKTKKHARAVTLPLLREQTEREEIVKALLDCNGNVTQAAKKLGLLRQTLQYKIRRFGIEI
jgi:tetratricopeptide (TPR) repeat protein